MEYDALNRMTGAYTVSKDGTEYRVSYTYDAMGRVISMTDELGTVDYTYDKNGNVLTVSDANGTITRKYDALDRVTEYTDYNGNTVKYGYDELGNMISLTYPGGEVVRYRYYKNGWLQSVVDAKGRTTSYTYDGNGNQLTCTRPNGTKEICTYNSDGLLIAQRDIRLGADGQEESELSSFTYSYDGWGNITSVTGTETAATAEGIANVIKLINDFAKKFKRTKHLKVCLVLFF